jgi:signal transduction histidine kinase/ligand-binding sensor domain-containing protein
MRKRVLIETEAARAKASLNGGALARPRSFFKAVGRTLSILLRTEKEGRRNEPRNQTNDHERATHFMIVRVISWFIFLGLLLSVTSLNDSRAQKAADEARLAQPNNLHQWGAVTLFHGLPSDRVRAIAQTPDGVLWFGTDSGLAKYDGRRTQALQAEGLKDARVLALRADADGALWIGTEEGATRMTGATFRFIKETEGKAVTAIITMERGRALLATDEGLLFDCRTQTDGSLSVKTMPDAPLLSADESRKGSALPLTSLAVFNDEILVGSHTRGLLSVNTEGARSIESRPRTYFIQALEKDAQGNLWMGARAKPDESGLYLSRDALRPVRVGEGLGTVSALGADGEGGVWVGTDGRGVRHFVRGEERARFTFENSSGGLRSNSVYAVFVDRERVVWFGTDKGVCRYDPRALRVELISDERESNFVRALFMASDGRLMAGTTRGLFILDTATNSWRVVERLSRNTVYAIAEARDGRLLAGTSTGLYVSQESVREVKSDTLFAPVEGAAVDGSSSDSVRSIVKFRGIAYAASFGRGLERVEPSGRTLLWPTAANSGQNAREVVSLFAENDAGLWIGTAGGDVLRFDGQRIAPVGGLDALKGSAVWDIRNGGDNFYWIASARGLYAFRRGELIKLFEGVDVRRVVVAQDQTGAKAAWCVTAGGGLLKVLITESFGALVSRLDVEQGLPSQSAFDLLLSKEKSGAESLLIGTSRGLARYEAGQAAPVLAATRIISRRVHQPEELREGLRLEYPQNSLVLDVQAASSRTFPEQFQYAFLLFDEAGRLVRQKLSRESQFMMEGLKPGRYRVEAVAYNADLIPSAPLSFEFGIAGAPFPWTTTALAVLLALALVALSWGYFQNRRMARTSRALLEANRNLADARLQVANQAERERRRIARDLHDQTLADLRNLILLTDQLPAKEAENGHERLDPSTFRSEIEAISTEIRRICEDLSPSVLENVGLAAALEWALSNSVAHAPADCRFAYEFKCPEDLEERVELAPGERMQIYRIAQESISNICRHSGAKSVKLEVKIGEDNSFLLELEDDGKDFDPKDKKRKRSGRGLSNILARASLIEAEVTWSKRPQGGTVFTLRKPSPLAQTESLG